MPARLSLPVSHRQVLDNSILESHGRCPRLTYYNYVLNRAADTISFPIQFGVAYHKFREVLENAYVKIVVEGDKTLDEVADQLYKLAVHEALKGWEDPPLEHRKAYLDEGRLHKTFESAFERWKREKQSKKHDVLMTETAFDLELPFDWTVCVECGSIASFEEAGDPCEFCETPDVVYQHPRFGGRADQILEWNGRLWLRDFKTTSRMGKSYSLKFDPNHQFSGYVWAAQKLSGREVEGVLVEVVYNTKRQGPEFHQFLSSRTKFHIDSWLEWVEYEYLAFFKNKRSGIWPQRTSSCDDYGGCFFREACRQSSWKMIEGWLENNTVYSNWDYQNPDEEEGLTAD